jgi:hypothetical protein
MKKPTLLLLVLCIGVMTFSQSRQTENIVLVTFDGLRWQELFGGADSVLINDSIFTSNRKATKEKFWAATADERRKKLFPFLWSTVAQQGQMYGNRWHDNKVNNANPHWFSYPGYNEILTGYPDTAVNSNDKILNKHETVLEFINKQAAYKGKVAAFTSWDVFDYIINEQRSGVFVSSGVDKLDAKYTSSPSLNVLNEMQQNIPQPLGASIRPDVVTYYMAKEYLKLYKPKVLYIAFDETDDWAHSGKYGEYLEAALFTDKYIEDIWNTVQSMPQYKGKTTLVITTDHGRGDLVKKQWKDHGDKIQDAYQIWFAAMGPDTQALGEVKTAGQLYQKQVAATVARLLSLNFTSNHPVAEPIANVLKK